MAEIDNSKKIYVDVNPGWLTNSVKHKNENYFKILDFYVVNAICGELSCKGKTASELGWGKQVWKKGILKNLIFETICSKEHFSDCIFIAKTNSDIRNGINNFSMDKHFHNLREEKIVVHKKYNLNQVESIFYHIRNSFAHGRFQIYSYKDELYYVFESGIIKKSIDKIELKARMVIKEKTLLKWIEILNNPIDDNK